jgi:hypothetical protein
MTHLKDVFDGRWKSGSELFNACGESHELCILHIYKELCGALPSKPDHVREMIEHLSDFDSKQFF